MLNCQPRPRPCVIGAAAALVSPQASVAASQRFEPSAFAQCWPSPKAIAATVKRHVACPRHRSSSMLTDCGWWQDSSTTRRSPSHVPRGRPKEAKSTAEMSSPPQSNTCPHHVGNYSHICRSRSAKNWRMHARSRRPRWLLRKTWHGWMWWCARLGASTETWELYSIAE